MNLVCWQLRSAKRERALLGTLQDFGLKRIAGSAAAGSLSKSDAKDIKARLEPLSSGPKDSILMIALCASCERCFLEANPKLGRLNLLEFEDSFQIY